MIRITIIIIVLLMTSFNHEFSFNDVIDDHKENNNISPILDFSTINSKKIGYYTASDSEYATASYYLMMYNAFGPYFNALTNFDSLDNNIMVIIPYTSNISASDISKIKTYISNGGIVYFTRFVPDTIINPNFEQIDEYAIGNTYSIPGIIQSNVQKAFINYNKIFKVSRELKFYPSEKPRELYIMRNVSKDFEVLHFAKVADFYEGEITITKRMGLGRVAFTVTPLFDLLGQVAIGGAILNDNIRGSLYSGSRVLDIINYMIQKLLFLQEYYIPQLWHTPYGKLTTLISRDDVDSYYKGAVADRGDIDRTHKMPTIFYELRDDIPKDDWPSVLDNYHLPGYHRHYVYEKKATSYLSRVLDIENETGQDMYFECHHGGEGSGWNGQKYVRTAIEASNNLTHPIIYTSTEGGHSNIFMEPYLYRDDNGNLIPSKNYYTYPKSNTIDKVVASNDVNGFYSRSTFLQFKAGQNFQYLLHSQNVQSVLKSRYDNLLKQVVDPIKPFLFSDPLQFVKLQLNNVQNVSSIYSQTSSLITTDFNVENDVNGYSMKLPLPDNKIVSSIFLDTSPINISLMQYSSDGYNIIFYLNMTKGNHQLKINFVDGLISKDLTNDEIQNYLTLNATVDDIDGDKINDGLEYFRYGSNHKLIDSDGDKLNDTDEILVYKTNPRNSDTDFDLMPDLYEVMNNHNPLIRDGDLDDDNDGISNLLEYYQSENITTTSTTSEVINTSSSQINTNYPIDTSTSDSITNNNTETTTNYSTNTTSSEISISSSEISETSKASFLIGSILIILPIFLIVIRKI